MAWSSLTSNQMVSFTDAQGGGFALKSGQSHITSNQCMTKSDALTKYNLDAAAMDAYASNQLVPAGVWVTNIVRPANSTTAKSFTQGNSISGNFTSSQQSACSAYSLFKSQNPPNTLVGATFYAVNFNVGDIVYVTNNVNNLAKVDTGHYITNLKNGEITHIVDGNIISITFCQQ